jgi:DUF4097 and DUF4098 domain-containing protein YvlB
MIRSGSRSTRTHNRRAVLALAMATVLCAGAAAPAYAQQDIDKVNGSITAEAGQRYGDLETVNGGIRIEDGATVDEASTVNGGIQGGDDVSARSLEAVNGGIKFGRNAKIAGSVETVNGGIYFDRGSVVRDGVSNVNGGIGLVGTEVGGDVETVAGDITIGADSHVKGRIHVEKPNNHGFGFNWKKKEPPRIVIGPNAVVDGPLVFERDVELYVHDSARIGRVSGATAKRYSGATPPGM